jgi:site-specific DNA-methyltransferase (adenine-specific)
MIDLNKIFNEPCLDTLKRMQDKSIDCVITSPPYWQLRDYGYEGQWGLEPTFQEYLEHLWEMMDEIYRVLKDEGTCWVNLGDTYARGSRAKYAYSNQSLRSKHEHLIEPNTKPDYNGLDKCLLLIPHRFAIGCIDRGWILRNDIIWAKRNGMPESVTDRFTKKHEYIFFMTKSEKYYFDLDAIRDKHKEVSINRNKYKLCSYNDENASRNREMKAGELLNDKGKNPGSVSDFWDITTKGNSSKHYASYNMDLIKKPILAGCPEGGIIYDPFMGTGTTAIGAINSNRIFIGSEMSEEYIKICEQNTKPLLQRIKLF